MGRLGLISMWGGMVGALLLTVVGCGSNDGYGREPVMNGDGGSATQAQTDELRRRRAARPMPSTTTATGSTATTGSSGGSTLTTEQVIAAAQTPDGAAIPQPSGANGACPEVVVRLGFWSCPTIGDACSFSSGGATTRCTCVRTDGEGQYPSWVCN